MAEITALAHIDVAAGKLERRVGPDTVDYLDRALQIEQRCDLDQTADRDLAVQATLGVPYSADMIANAQADVTAQATNDNPGAADLAKRYPKVNARDFDGDPKRITEADALIAYLQLLGTEVNFKLYDDKANIR